MSDHSDDFKFVVPLPPPSSKCLVPPPATVTSTPPPSIIASMPPPSTVTSVSPQPSVTQSTPKVVTIKLSSSKSTESPMYNTQGPIPLFLPLRDSGGQHRLSPFDEYDGKRLRKSGLRKTVNYNASIARMLQNRIWQRDHRDRPFLQPDVLYTPQLLPPQCYKDNPISSVATTFVKTVTNKVRCHVFCLVWTPEGRRLITGSSSGEFTLWNGLTFNFETISQAHDCAIRSMVWSHNSSWMVTGDHSGYIKYWQSNMNNVKMFQAHTEPIRGISFSQSDEKFATCSDDGTIRVWDFFTSSEEKILRGHGAEVKCIDWHPFKGLLISGSKDNQQPIKLWDPKTGKSLATIHAHKSTVMDIKWNANGNWVVTASRDHLVKLFDVRNLSRSFQTLRGHKKEASAVTWHPYHESLLCSGGSDGSILYWNVGVDKMVGSIDQAHESIIWSLAWNPLGEVLCSGSSDFSCKFWTRNRPGEQINGKYTTAKKVFSIVKPVPTTTETKSINIPGLGLEDFSEDNNNTSSADSDTIPLNLNHNSTKWLAKARVVRKVPYSKPIDKYFQRNWNDPDMEKVYDESPYCVPDRKSDNDVVNSFDNIPGSKPSRELEPNSLIAYGQMIKVNKNSELEYAIKGGQESLEHFLRSGAVPEVRQYMPFESNDDPIYKYAKYFHRNDHDSRTVSPMNNLPTNQDADNRINNTYHVSHGFSRGLQTSPGGIFNVRPRNQLFNTVAQSRVNLPTSTRFSSYRNNFPNYSNRPFPIRNQMNRRYGRNSIFTGSNFTRPFYPQGPFTKYNNM